MTPVCPFVEAARPDEASSKEPSEKQSKQLAGHESKAKEPGEPTGISPKCPFGYDSGTGQESEEKESVKRATISPKCPFGYDSETFKIGPLSCVICKALLFECTKCVPCSHVYCKACISRYKDCPLCGADIEKIEAEENLQSVVDRFIEGHARIKRPQVNAGQEELVDEKKTVIYEDVSLERGAFLVQQATRAFRANNVESAKSRLTLCAEDIREQLERMGNTLELCSQLGAVLGMLGDCCRAMGDVGSAIAYFEESIDFLSKVQTDDMEPEITHTLSVSLNKIGDLKYYDGDLQASRSYYSRALTVRRSAIEHKHGTPSQILDVATSLAKVADADRSLGNEDAAIDGFQEAINLLKSLTLSSEETVLEHRCDSVLEFLHNQLDKK